MPHSAWTSKKNYSTKLSKAYLCVDFEPPSTLCVFSFSLFIQLLIQILLINIIIGCKLCINLAYKLALLKLLCLLNNHLSVVPALDWCYKKYQKASEKWVCRSPPSTHLSPELYDSYLWITRLLLWVNVLLLESKTSLLHFDFLVFLLHYMVHLTWLDYTILMLDNIPQLLFDPLFSWPTILPSHESEILLVRTEQPTRGAHQVN